MAEVAGLLIKVRGDGAAFDANARSLRIGKASVQPILALPPDTTGDLGAAPAGGATWLKLGPETRRSENPWDDAHRVIERSEAFAAAGGPPVLAIEPDIVQRWDYKDGRGDRGMAASASPVCTFDNQDPAGGQATGPGLAWNAGANFGQFAAARAAVGAKQGQITIAHLDTGLDPAHQTKPLGIVPQSQWRNFVNDGHGPTDAVDHAPAGSPTSNRGHGTGTLSLLAGNKLDGTSPGWAGFADFVGGAPEARIIPIRIADWVVRFTTSTMVQGIDYARQQGAQVLSMSMGGLSSSLLVDAINLAYDHGVVMVTAAGNNFAFVPTPKTIVFPARYQRVLAACGLMADGRAYAGLRPGTMQGNYGPNEKMKTALGAYTPNVPWAEIDCGKIVDMDGSGTSAATPQIAAAAALWLAEHWSVVNNYSQPWMRIEAVRFALFSKALKSTPKMGTSETFEKIGQGVVQAQAALAVAPPAENRLRKLPPAEESWGWINLLLGDGGVSVAPTGRAALQKRRMLALELTQMAQRVASVEAAISDPGADPATIPATAGNRYLEAALDEGNPSKPLRAVLERALGRPGAKPAAAPGRQMPPVKRKPRPQPPPKRRLRIYALDPSIAKRLNSVSVFQATLQVPWDDQPATAEPLQPGPVGEYIEVVDIDPASNLVYDPVDLNEKTLLAQDGLTPSEGNPRFHQQMVYAVAMTTIGHFERALGRRALWAPRYAKYTGRDGDLKLKGYEVPRLRIYPHALRTDNAYYSPDKKALLFGYFPADSREGDVTTPGSTVFSCLSSDIVAHETSHALLDGLHRRFQEASNPDVPAFHEGFADIVALFQHFTLKELVSFELARSRGVLSAANLLSGLAKQFGEGSGRAGPLRDYAGPKMADLDYDKTFEPHDRGSILVFAVYEAFIAIITRRTESLIQLATGGSGILPDGALHPGLVDRLADETAKSARQVLTMCIRALDYCPAMDITFGEYLRALITADIDAFPDDPMHYRLAFLESFRKWKLLPRDVRTVSEETLTWNTLDDPSPKWLYGLLEDIDLRWNQKLSRSEIFALNERNRWVLWTAMKKAFAADPEIYSQFGLLPNLPRYNDDGTLLKKARKDESTFDVFSVRPTRRVEPDGSFRTEVVVVIHQRIPVRPDGTAAMDGVKLGGDFFWFRGGATVIIDPRKGREEVRYSIVKNTGGAERLKRQAEMATLNYLSPLRALYFGDRTSEPFALLHQSHEKSKKLAEPAASAATAAAVPATSAGAAAPVLTVRHYCQDIGDCHLRTFRKDDGSLFRILIDCGIHTSITGGPALVRDIVADIKAATGGKIDVIAVTHEHWDHVSGFFSAADIFKDFTVGEVWMPWTENPQDPDAVALDKFKGEALSALQGATLRLDADKGMNGYANSLRDGLQALLGFQFGAAGERVRAARDAAAKLSAKQPPVYMDPGTAPFSIPGLPNLRIYVLGPPRSKEALKLEERASEMYALSGAGGGPFMKALSAGLAANSVGAGVGALIDDASPFDPSIGTDLSAVLGGGLEGDVADFVERRYSGRLPSDGNRIDDETATDQSWRRVDSDWLGIAADLAMQLDRGVNNTSLVLAFEALDTGRVFLFPGDAQVGNWLSWQDVKWPVGPSTVKATDLMARTVYLKVAHHGSQNATLEEHGLEMMVSPDLSAFIPTNKADALKVHWGEMPYHSILKALATKTSSRVIRADDEWLAAKNGTPGFAVPSGSILAVRNATRDQARGKGGLWVELDLG